MTLEFELKISWFGVSFQYGYRFGLRRDVYIMTRFWGSPIVLPIVCCFISWRLRRPHWENADRAEGIFGFCWTRVECGPASGPTLKKAFCRTCLVVGRRTNKVGGWTAKWIDRLALRERERERDHLRNVDNCWPWYNPYKRISISQPTYLRTLQ